MEIESENSEILTRQQMSRYVSYARDYIKPKIPEELIGEMVEQYVNMRRLGTCKKTITATPR